MVQHAVDVGVAVLGAEAFHRFQRLVDHDAVRHVLAVREFVGGDAQRGALDRIDVLDGAVEEGRERGVERIAVRIDTVDEILEVGQVGDLARLLVGELGDDVARAGAGQLPGIDGLQRATARAGAQDRIDAIRTAVLAHASFSIRFAISITTSAVSSPLLPWLPPARASASS